MKDIYIVSSQEKKLYVEKKVNNAFQNSDFDILTEKELKDGVLSSLDERAILFVKDKGYSFSNAEKICKYLLNVFDYKLDTVDCVSILNELKEKKFLNSNPYFARYLNNKNIILSPLANNYQTKSLLNKVLHKKDYVVDNMNNNVEKRKLFFFEKIEEEYEAIFSIIKDCLDGKNNIRKTRIDKIKIVNSEESVSKKINLLNKFYKFPIIEEVSFKKRLLKGYSLLLEKLKENSLKDALFELQEDDLIKELIPIYIRLKDDFSDSKILDYFSYYVEKNTTSKSDGAIEFVSKDYIPRDDEVLIVPSFVFSIYPSYISDNSYPSDAQIKAMGFNDSSEKNRIEKIRFSLIYNSKAEVIFLKHKFAGKKECYASSYEDEYDFNQIDNYKPYYFSSRAKDLKLSISGDNALLYGEENHYKNQLENELKNYRTYDHQYKTISIDKKDNIKLSYSSLSKYCNCPFSYYLSRILKIDPFVENENIRKGRIFHKYLEDKLNNVEKDFNQYLIPYDLSNKEIYYLNRTKESVDQSFEIQKDLVNSTTFNKVLSEYKIDNIKITDKVSLEGTLDIVILDEQNKNVLVLDYKTGSQDFVKKYVKFGYNLQLPIYLLLLSKSEEFKNYLPLGAYISPLIENDYLKKGKASALRFKGITRIEDEYRKPLEPYVAGIVKNKKGGFRSENHVVKEDEMNQILSITEDYVKSSGEAILNHDFAIKPKHIDKVIVCKFCTYKDICFKENIDEEVFVTEKESKVEE